MIARDPRLAYSVHFLPRSLLIENRQEIKSWEALGAEYVGCQYSRTASAERMECIIRSRLGVKE